MLQGFYRMELVDPQSNHKHSLLILENGLVRGGDNTHYYTGEYILMNHQLVIDLTSTLYFGSTFNAIAEQQTSKFRLSGFPSIKEMNLIGIDKDSSKQVYLSLVRVADIPLVNTNEMVMQQ